MHTQDDNQSEGAREELSGDATSQKTDDPTSQKTP